MTARAGAPSTKHILWNTINWSEVEYEVKRLQSRIAKAIKEGRHSKAKTLQWLLTQFVDYFNKREDRLKRERFNNRIASKQF
jgi:hypothetical protein